MAEQPSELIAHTDPRHPRHQLRSGSSRPISTVDALEVFRVYVRKGREALALDEAKESVYWDQLLRERRAALSNFRVMDARVAHTPEYEHSVRSLAEEARAIHGEIMQRIEREKLRVLAEIKGLRQHRSQVQVYRSGRTQEGRRFATV